MRRTPIVAIACSFFLVSNVCAQIAGGGRAGGGGMGGGITIDANGILKAGTSKTGGKKAKPQLREELARRADLRRISLKSLDAQLRKAKVDGVELPDELRYLAGLNRIEFVIFDSTNRDVLLAGPAEGWTYANDGRPVGMESRRPVIHLEDLAVALRCVLAGRGAVDCSIDPTRDGLAKVRQLVPEGISTRQQADQFKNRVANGMGLQTVRTAGVPADSKFALTMVEADYRMKRLALGGEKYTGLNSHLDTLVSLAGTGATTFNLARWWFTPNYLPLAVSDDGSVYQIRGQALKLLNEEVMFDENGDRHGTGRSNDDWDRFSKSFTKLLPNMESKILPFADLHNLFDLMLAAGLIKHVGHGDWFADAALLDEAVYSIPKYQTPRRAEPVIGSDLSKNMQLRKYIFTFCYGGVSMNPGALLGSGGMTTAAAGPAATLLGGGKSTGTGNSSGGSISVPTDHPAKSTNAGSSNNEKSKSEIPADWWTDLKRPKDERSRAGTKD